MHGCKKQRLCSWDSSPNLSTAACELRAATTTSKLQSCLAREEARTKEVEAFYERLSHLQNNFEVSPWYKPIIVSVEGAKRTNFIEDLAAMFRPSPVRVASSPPASLGVVRGIFQQLGGSAAKAFDVVSNYMAVQECKDVCMAEHQPLVSWILLLILDECDIFFWRTVKTHPPFQGKFLHHFFI